MTNIDIIKAAFKVWGRELYINTSLSMIAKELGVSKPALYRHFKNKQALLNAMYDFFFDDFSTFILPGYERSVQMENPTERFLLLMRTITEYYALHGDFFIFSLIQVYGNHKKDRMLAALRARNIDIECLFLFTLDKNDYPSSMQMVTSTITFWIAHFHKHEQEGAVLEQAIPQMVHEVEQQISYGLA
ncbi:TetR/AcrR family transcriptional regulator, partial [Breznakiellaceae bacterium SP9]